MLHSNFRYKACRNYSGGLSAPDLLGRSVLCYGKPGSGKTAALGVCFMNHTYIGMNRMHRTDPVCGKRRIHLEQYKDRQDICRKPRESKFKIEGIL